MASPEHKLKTPLTVVAGLASTLTHRWDDIDDGRRRTLVETIDRRCGELTLTVEAMLAEAQADASSPRLEMRALYVEQALRAIADDFAPVSDRHVLRVECDAHLLCIADSGALGQVLGHLVENAIKYTAAGEIELRAASVGDRVVVSVTDHGSGLPPGDLFAPFVRGASNMEASGTGLGLYVVRTLVDAMGGTTETASAPHGGAVVSVTLAGA